MSNTKIKTWVSDEGEVFEGTQKELMEEYGIKNRMGFSRPAGAPDADGNRWLSEEDYQQRGFKRPQLYLGAYYKKELNHLGKPVSVGYEPSDTAITYLLYKDLLKNDPYSEFADEAYEHITVIESKYEVVDNRDPTSKGLKDNNQQLEWCNKQRAAVFAELAKGGSESKWYSLMDAVHRLDQDIAMLKVKIYGADAVRVSS